MLAACFKNHLVWLLDAASGCIALSQDMMLDASSPDNFARTLLNRAACLKLPLVAASCMAKFISTETFVHEKEEIKRQLSEFKALGSALDRL
jgi:hypothetical protein